MKKVWLLCSIFMIGNPNTNIDNQTPIKREVKQDKKEANNFKYIGKVETNGGALNIRKEASSSSSILTKVINNSYIEIDSEQGNFYKVKYNTNSYGYASKTYVKKITSEVWIVNTATLNVRKGPSTSYTKIDTIKLNKDVNVIDKSSSWFHIVYDGMKTGYVSSSYLKSNQASKTYVYPKKELDVISYKQFDSRWANQKLGNSNTTFSKSGCATTGLAMLESYRTKVNITPLAYSKKMKYTSSGAIYWPTSTYNVDSSSSNYLAKIYNQLKNNKPVMIGLKNSSGAQHYVVITGYKGGDILVAKNFVINDPGSSYRYTLDQVLAIRPLFHKLVYAK